MVERYKAYLLPKVLIISMKTKTGKVAVWGASGHARVVADILLLMGYELAGYLDNISPSREGEKFGGSIVLAGLHPIESLQASGIELMALGVGDNNARLAIGEKARSAGLTLTKAVHPRATIASSVQIGDGTVIAAGTVVNPDSIIGIDAIINTMASIDHECMVGDGAHIAPGVCLTGNVDVGRGTFVGAGSTVRNGVKIGSQSIVGAGSVVLKDIPPKVLVYGAPAKIIRKLDA